MNLQELIVAVEALSLEEQTKFRAWFWEFDNQVWDAQIEADVKVGKFDKLADHAAGKTKPL